MALKVKTFRVTDDQSEQQVNDFLQNKVVRHWATHFTGGSLNSEWQVFVAYDDADQNQRNARQNDRMQEGSGRRERGDRNGSSERGNDRGSDRNAPLRERREPKEPRPEPHVVDVSEADMPLYEAIRKWRNARAREENIKPFTLFNNRQLETIVKSKPSTTDELRTMVPDMEAPKFDRYQNELLGFIAGAGASDPASPAVQEPTDVTAAV